MEKWSKGTVVKELVQGRLRDWYVGLSGTQSQLNMKTCK